MTSGQGKGGGPESGFRSKYGVLLLAKERRWVGFLGSEPTEAIPAALVAVDSDRHDCG